MSYRSGISTAEWSDPAQATGGLKELSLEMCGGEDLHSYIAEFRAKGQSQCTNVWSKNIIAYRCRTCQHNESSAICVECFQGGNHAEHDYVMYHSESGGCCDCGDRAAWKKSGFCTAHQCPVREAVVRDELLQKTHMAVKFVLKELLVWVEKMTDVPTSSERINMAMIYLDWLQQVCSVDALRKIVCEDALTKYIEFQEICVISPLNMLMDTLPTMSEKIIEAEATLFLQLLYRNDFKNDFAELLQTKYEGMIVRAVDDQEYSKNYEYLDTNLDRENSKGKTLDGSLRTSVVMVQLFNDPDVTTSLIYNHKLLELFVGVFCEVISQCVDNRTSSTVNVEHEAIKRKVYLRPQGDVRLVVAHGDIAVNMLRHNPEIYLKILDVLIRLQWMNPYKLEDDIEFKTSWKFAIQLEMNSMAIIFQLVSRCYQDPQFGRETLVTAANHTLKALNLYLMQVDFTSETVSLHIPLHRTLSAIIGKLVLLPWDQAKDGFLSGLDFTYTDKEVLHFMEHPLRILFWMAQIRAQKWQRSSDEFSRLELIYRGSFWHDQSMDMDILMLQFCAVARQDLQEKIFTLIAKTFKLEEMVTTPITSRRNQDISLLRDFIRLILLVVRERRNLGLKDEKCLQYDVIQWLCVRNQTYSQLCQALSAVPVEHEKLNRTLEKVAIYHEPKTAWEKSFELIQTTCLRRSLELTVPARQVSERGYYQLKAEYWKEFDPLFAHYYPSELEEAQERAVKVGKLEHYWRIIAPPVAGAPYDCLPNLLHTQACHLFLMNVLSEVKILVKEERTATAGEALGVTALQMMAVVLSDRREHPGSAQWRSSFSEAAPVPTYNTKEDISVNVYLRLDNRLEKPLSIHQMLLGLQCASNCSRLVDSVNHVLELLSSFSNLKSFGAEINSSQMSVARLQVNSLTAEDEQRRLRKARQQKAILEQFAARQKDFLEQVDESSGIDTPMECRHKEGQSVGEGTSGSRGVLETSPEDVSETFGSDCNSMETEYEAKECVLCRSKSDVKNSATCWIALVQRYNMPNFVVTKGQQVNLENTDVSSTSGQLHEEGGEGGNEQFVVIQEGSNCIDLLTTEHVQCCGHQMHFECFQVHFHTLQLSHASGYAGKGILDLSRCEFLCPICRRLANVLLPDAEASMSTRKLLAHEDRGGQESRKEERSSWEVNQNLEIAVDFFATQSKRVRGNFRFLGVETKGFTSCMVLWEVLGQNIVHCEVETRDVVGKEEEASSSSTRMQICEVDVWGGDSAHWIAMRELGKLAMLVNRLPGDEQEKMGLRAKLRQSLGLCGKREAKRAKVLHRESASYADGMTETIKIIEEMFGEPNLDLTQPDEISLESFPIQNGESGKEMLMSTREDSANMDMHMEERAEKHQEALEPAQNVSMINADMSAPIACLGDERNPLRSPQTDGPLYSEVNRLKCQDDQLQDCETYQEDRKFEEVVPPSLTETEEDLKHWSSYLLNDGVLAADPFGLLIVLLISFKGQPKQRQILAMVKFAYTVAVIQTESAVRTAGADPSFSNSMLQGACLPFLRRAAMLVQIVTRDDFRKKLLLPGRKMMDALFLQQALELPECREVLDSNSRRGRGTLVTHLQNYVEKVTKTDSKLYRVPRKVLLYGLPRIFQELLLKYIHNKESCEGRCRKMPPDPAICLLCGKLLCCGTECCRNEGIGECSKHAAEESAGVGIFLLLRSTQLLLLRNNRFCKGPSLYLDTHGEEDRYLRRSQLLHLSNLRLNEVRRLYLTAAFDYDSYILHNSQLNPNYH